MLHIMTRRAVLVAVLLAGIGIASAAPAQQPASDPLPSWNDGTAKRAIIDFVARVTLECSAEFVPAPERIATFDNDGTLWAEQPIYCPVRLRDRSGESAGAEAPGLEDASSRSRQ